MSQFKIQIKLVSEYRHHGTHGIANRKQRSGAAAKARSLLKLGSANRTENDQDQTSDTEGDGEKVPRKAKPYGSHNGNVHVQTLYSKDLTSAEEIDRILVYLDNVTSKFESYSSWDLPAAKNVYSLAKEELLSRFRQNFGENLSEANTNKLVTELAKSSFDYTQHQIVIVLTSDDAFEGSVLIEDSYRRELRTKRIYSQGRALLPQEVREILVSISKDKSMLTSVSTIGRSARIVTNPKTGKLETSIDFGQLGGRVFDTSTY